MSTSKHFVPILATKRESHLSICTNLDNLGKAYIAYTAIGPRNGIKHNYVNLDYDSAVWLYRMLGKMLEAEALESIDNE